MKRFWSIVLVVIMLVSIFPTSVFAANETQKYEFQITADGQTEKRVQTGDVITVALYLNRTDADADYTMYSMQDEIRYDSNFFELVEGSEFLASGIEMTDIALTDHYREFYMNFVSFTGGETWKAKKQIGTFKLRVIAESGVSKITNQDFLVSLKDGSGSYDCLANELTIILTTDCIVHFETNGGSKIDDVTAIYGEKLTKPADPTKDGKYFAGWYKNIDCTEKWDFEKDTVSGNMTLYAKWSDTPIVDADTKPSTDIDDPNSNLCWLWLLLIILAIVIIIIILVKRSKKDLFEKVRKCVGASEKSDIPMPAYLPLAKEVMKKLDLSKYPMSQLNEMAECLYKEKTDFVDTNEAMAYFKNK